MRAGSNLSCSDHDGRVQELDRREQGKKNSIITLDFSRSEQALDFFRDLCGIIPCHMSLDGRGVQESWLISRITFSMLKISLS